MKRIIFLVCTGIFSTVIWAEDAWQCANSIAEITCQQTGSCKARHTPENAFHISIKNNSHISVCSANKCWKGSTQPSFSGNAILYPMKQFSWTTLEQPNAEYILAVDRLSHGLSIQGNDRSYPLQCVQT